MSDFEHFAAFFGNLIDLYRRHNGFWGAPSERSTPAVERLADGTLRHPDNDIAACGAAQT